MNKKLILIVVLVLLVIAVLVAWHYYKLSLIEDWRKNFGGKIKS